MIRRFSPWLLSALLLLGAAACHRTPSAPKPVILGFPKLNTSNGSKGVPRMVGKISMVNESGKFVLVESDAWNAPAEGTALRCMRDGKETGVVNVGKERRSSFVTADIVTGHPQRGDEVFQ
jgi:hypothetical protein